MDEMLQSYKIWGTWCQYGRSNNLALVVSLYAWCNKKAPTAALFTQFNWKSNFRRYHYQGSFWFSSRCAGFVPHLAIVKSISCGVEQKKFHFSRCIAAKLKTKPDIGFVGQENISSLIMYCTECNTSSFLSIDNWIFLSEIIYVYWNMKSMLSTMSCCQFQKSCKCCMCHTSCVNNQGCQVQWAYGVLLVRNDFRCCEIILSSCMPRSINLINSWSTYHEGKRNKEREILTLLRDHALFNVSVQGISWIFHI